MTLYKVGKIVNTHGIKGELKILSITDFPKERFKKDKELILDNNIHLKIQSVRKHKNFYLILFENLNDINLVEKYKGLDIFTEENNVDDLSNDEYYYHDIIGLHVIDNITDEEVGIVHEIIPLDSNDVWVIKTLDNKEIYIPYTEEVVKNIDLSSKIININLLDGIK